MPTASCSAPCGHPAPTRYSLRTSRTSSTRLARIGSTLRRARRRSSVAKTAATSSSPACRWKNGLALPRRQSDRALARTTTPGRAQESEQDWRELLLGLKRRGLDVRPQLALADVALRF